MTVRMRHTRAHTANRRSHHALSGMRLTRDTETGSVHIRHRVSPGTGKYRGRQVIDVAAEALKKQKRLARKEEQIRAERGPAAPREAESEKKTEEAAK